MKTKKDRLWLVEYYVGGDLRRRAVLTTIKGVWAQCKVWLDTADPNLDYRALTREAAKGPVQLYCTRRWATEDEALYNPVGEIIIISLVPLIKMR
jgi:hypothetical protein